jgi:ribosome maturation factor RimP
MRYPVGFGPLFLLGKSSANLFICAQVMDSGSVADRISRIAEQAAIDHGVELVHAEVAGPEGHPIVRVFIEKPGGVTHEDCSHVSTQIGTVLDVEDFIHSAYTLEVSSPGLERGLYKLADYERFAGSPARIKTRLAVNNQRNFRGRIVGIESDTVVFDDRTTGSHKIRFDSIAKANLEVDVESEFHRAREKEALDKELIERAGARVGKRKRDR